MDNKNNILKNEINIDELITALYNFDLQMERVSDLFEVINYYLSEHGKQLDALPNVMQIYCEESEKLKEQYQNLFHLLHSFIRQNNFSNRQ